MSIKQTDIRLMEINIKLGKILDRLNELRGEKTTLLFKLEHGNIHPILFTLKAQALDFEVMLLEGETENLKAEFDTINLVADIGLDFTKEHF